MVIKHLSFGYLVKCLLREVIFNLICVNLKYLQLLLSLDQDILIILNMDIYYLETRREKQESLDHLFGMDIIHG